MRQHTSKGSGRKGRIAAGFEETANYSKLDRAAWGRNGPVSALGGSHFGAEMGTGDRLDLEGGLRELLSFASVILISGRRRDDTTGFFLEHGTCL